MDVVSKAARSRIMSKVKSSETDLERTFRLALWGLGIRYKKNNTKYFGKPDLLFRKRRIVAFIDSCFWHGCKEHLRMPNNNRHYWKNKIERNKNRDIEVNKYYGNQGWKVLRVWEHELINLKETADKFKNQIIASSL